MFIAYNIYSYTWQLYAQLTFCFNNIEWCAIILKDNNNIDIRCENNANGDYLYILMSAL